MASCPAWCLLCLEAPRAAASQSSGGFGMIPEGIPEVPTKGECARNNNILGIFPWFQREVSSWPALGGSSHPKDVPVWDLREHPDWHPCCGQGTFLCPGCSQPWSGTFPSTRQPQLLWAMGSFIIHVLLGLTSVHLGHHLWELSLVQNIFIIFIHNSVLHGQFYKKSFI